MPTRNNAESPKRHSHTNAIHPEIEILDDLSQRERQNGVSTSKQTNYDDLFSSNVIRCTKSYMVNVRDNRFIHVKQYLPPETNETTGNEDTNKDERRDSAVVLFFIHGVGGSCKIWESQIQKFLLDGYEIIALDLLGHGMSSTPDGYTPYEFRELASDVLFVFDKFCKHRNVLIGHSYGTSFCALLSMERRHLIWKMVMISGGGPTSLMPDRCSAFCLPLPIFFLIQPLLLKFFRRMAFHVKTSRRVQDKITTFGLSAHVLKAIMQGQVWEESDEQYHANLAVPALLIYGSGDEFVTLQDEIWMNETIYNSSLEVVEDAGHMVMIEAPLEVNNLIGHFLNQDTNTSHRGDLQSASEVMMQNDVSPLHEASNSPRLNSPRLSGPRLNGPRLSGPRSNVPRCMSAIDVEPARNTPTKRCRSSTLSRISSATKSRGKKMY